MMKIEIENIKYWFIDLLYRTPKYKITSFWYRLKRSSKWFYRTWNLPDWDYDFLIKMIVYKLKDMRYQFDVIDSDSVDLRHQPLKYDSDESDYVDRLKGLDDAIEIGERIVNGDYHIKDDEIDKWLEEHGCFKERMSDDLRERLFNNCKISEDKEENDRRMFFDILYREHQYWWT